MVGAVDPIGDHCIVWVLLQTHSPHVGEERLLVMEGGGGGTVEVTSIGALLMNVCFTFVPNALEKFKTLLNTIVLFTCKSLTIIFYSEHVERKNIPVKLLQIIKHTFRNTNYSRAVQFRSTMKWLRLTRFL